MATYAGWDVPEQYAPTYIAPRSRTWLALSIPGCSVRLRDGSQWPTHRHKAREKR